MNSVIDWENGVYVAAHRGYNVFVVSGMSEGIRMLMNVKTVLKGGTGITRLFVKESFARRNAHAFYRRL